MKKAIVSMQDYPEFVAYLESGTIPERYNSDHSKRQSFRRRIQGYYIDEERRLCITVNGLKKFIVCHDDATTANQIIMGVHMEIGHRKRDEVFRRISETYVGITRQAVMTEILKCPNCQRMAPLTSNPGIIPIRAFRCWERVQMDVVDLSEYAHLNDGYRYLCNLIDCFSKYLFSIPMLRKDAITVHDFLFYLFEKEGTPYILHTDNGKEFKNTRVQELCRFYNIKFLHGRARRPQSQGQVERLNQTISNSIKATCYAMRTWLPHLDKLVSEYNKCGHRATGATPFEIFRGRPYKNNDASVLERIQKTIFDDAIEVVDLPEEPEETAQNVPEVVLVNNEHDDNDIMNRPSSSRQMLEQHNQQTESYLEDNLSEGSENFIEETDFDEFIQNMSAEMVNELFQGTQAECEQRQQEISDLANERSNRQAQVIAHNAKYYERMIKNTSVHSRNPLRVNDMVLISKDYDTNPKTRKTFFSENFSVEGRVMGATNNGKYKVKLLNGEEKIFALNQLKRKIE